MVYFYATAFLAVCNKMDLNVNDDNAPRQFLKELYEWMYESYVCMGAGIRAARAFDNNNIVWPSQPNMRYWFDGIKKIMDFTWKDEVTNWFGEVTDENEIDLAFNMLRILDQKNFIESYGVINDGNGDIITQRMPVLNLPNMVTSNTRGYDLVFQPDGELRSVVSTIDPSEDINGVVRRLFEDNTEEEHLPEPSATDVEPNLTVRGSRLSRVLDFDDFVANLSHEINNIDEIVDDENSPTDPEIPDLISDSDWDHENEYIFGNDDFDTDADSDSETETDGSIRV